MAICIAGTPRSGASMVVRLLHECGIYLGDAIDLVPTSPDNKQGHWENRHFVDINDRVLATLGGGWDFPPRIGGEWQDVPELAACRDDATRLIIQFDPHSPWAWNDPRNSLTLPFWASVVLDLQVVVCLRHPLDFAESLRRGSYNSPEFGLNLWQEYNRRVLADISPAKRVITHVDSYFVQPREELERLLTRLGLPTPPSTLDRVCETVAGQLRDSRRSSVDLSATTLPESVKELYAQMCKEAGVADARPIVGRSTHRMSIVDTRPESVHTVSSVNSAESSEYIADVKRPDHLRGSAASLSFQVDDLIEQRDSLRLALDAAEEVRELLEQEQIMLRERLELVDHQGLLQRQLMDKLRGLSTRVLTGQVRPIERILVVKTSSDFYCSAALDQIATVFPHAKVMLWTEERESEAFYSHRGIERIILYRNIRSIPKMLRDLRSVRADLVVTQSTYESTYAKMLVLAGLLLPGAWLVYDEHAGITAAGGLRVKVETTVGSLLAGGRWVEGVFWGAVTTGRIISRIFAAPFVVLGLLLGAAHYSYARYRYLRRVLR